jgi:hypothetical protein
MILIYEAFPKLQFWESTLKFAVLQGFSLKTARAFGSSLFQNCAPGCAGDVSAQSISANLWFDGTGSSVKYF